MTKNTSIAPALQALLNATDAAEVMRLLQQYPVLMHPDTDAHIAHAIQQADAATAHKLESLRTMLQAMRGIDTDKQDDDLPQALREDIQAANQALRQYRQTGQTAFVEAEVAAWARVLAHPDFARADAVLTAGVLNDSANAWQRRYEIKGDAADLEQAVTAWQKAILYLPLESPLMPALCNNLGNGLTYRYAHSGKLDDLEQSILATEKAVELAAPDSRDVFKYWNNLGNALRERYLRTAQAADLDRAIKCYREALQRLNRASPLYPQLQNNLAIALTNRYIHAGEERDLTESIRAFQQAVEKTAPDSPALPTMLNNLGIALRERYGRTGQLDDLEQGIQAHQRARELTPPASPDLPARYNNLGNALNEKYARSRDMAVLEAVVSAYRQAVETSPPDSPDLPGRLNNFAAMLNDYYLRTLDTAYLDQSIDAYRRAIERVNDRTTTLAALHSNLGNALRNRYHRLKRMADLHEAITSYRRALDGLSETAPDRPTIMNNLANGLSELYEASAQATDLADAVAVYEQAARQGLELSPQFGLGSAKNWLNWAFRREAWAECAKAYRYARDIGERLVRLQILRDDKESWLRDLQGIAAKAAYALAKLDQPEQAVMALETGLARLLSEVLERDRADLERLKDGPHHALYQKYHAAVAEFQRCTQAVDQQPETARTALRAAHTELERVVAAIREVEADFLRPPSFDTVQQAAQTAPVLYIAATESGGVALQVNRDTSVIWLPLLDEDSLKQAVQIYLDDYRAWQQAEPAQRRQATANWFANLEGLSAWLGKVLEPLWSHLEQDTELVLIPVGLLNLLPLHLARIGDDYALDKFCIRYTPNARALAGAGKPNISPGNILIVDEPDSEGAAPLKGSAYECAAIARYFPSEILRHAQATQQTVLKQMPNCAVLHLSCHGYADLEKPLDSGLALSGQEFLSLRDLLAQRLPGLRLATLSACETGIPGTALPEEVVNLPAGLLQAGVAGIVASLWAVSDLSTMLLMTRFYFLCREDNLPPPQALRQAQQWVRDSSGREKTAFLRWVLPKEQAKTVRKAMGMADYRHPFYWGAFGYSGV